MGGCDMETADGWQGVEVTGTEMRMSMQAQENKKNDDAQANVLPSSGKAHHVLEKRYDHFTTSEDGAPAQADAAVQLGMG